MSHPSEALMPRISALLNLADGRAFSEIDPQPSAAELGAAGAIAYEWADQPIRATVYEFGDYWQAAEAQAALTSRRASSGEARTSVNGGLLLWLVAGADDPAALSRLDEIVGAFAGEE